MKNHLTYPSSAEFAFTILDDTDDTTVANGKPVNELLNELGLRTTKTVWSFDTPPENRGPYFAGETLSSPEYLAWTKQLFSNGFEIAFHNATMGSSPREDTIKALDMLKKEFDNSIRLHCNHGQNRENLHWGSDRYSSYLIKKALKLLTRFHTYPAFSGNDKTSEYYWSDVADDRVAYMRAFAFQQLDGSKIAPGRPFLDTTKQKRTLFFNTTDAPNVSAFNRCVNPASIDKLRENNGWSIVTTHFGKGFFHNNKINQEFKETMEYLASLPGCFIPVSPLLDHLKAELGGLEISPIERFRLEYSHVLDRIKSRLSD